MQASEQLPFLFIHGAGGTKDKWRLVQEHLTQINAEYVDLPGHGTDSNDSAGSVEQYAELLGDSIRQDVIVVGHSMGGLIGIELANRNRHVKGLVLVASHYVLPVHPGILSKLQEGVYPDSLFYASYSKQVSRELLDQERLEIVRVPKQTIFLDFDSCNRYLRGREMISQLKIPVLAVYGEDDRLLPAAAREDTKAVNPQISTRMITNSGHYIMLEQPEKLVNALLHFHETEFSRGKI